jgi:hypothetical protein
MAAGLFDGWDAGQSAYDPDPPAAALSEGAAAPVAGAEPGEG